MGLHEIQNADAKERIVHRLGGPIAQEDYLLFIEPYEGIKHLNQIHDGLEPTEILDLQPVTLESVIIDFPGNLPLIAEEMAGFHSLHDLLSSINGPIEGIAYARRETEKKRRPSLLRLFWTCGAFGHLDTEKGPCLVIDSKTYAEQKNQAIYSRVQCSFKILQDYGVYCAIEPIVENEWLTPGGGLRAKVSKKAEPAWFMKMSFEDRAGGLPALTALQKYANMLNKIYREKAFKLFSKADMRILSVNF